VETSAHLRLLVEQGHIAETIDAGVLRFSPASPNVIA